jgi:hypothetical protein
VKLLVYLISFFLTNVVAVLASTFILRFKPITWLLEAYFWSEFAINFFAYLVGAYAGLQVARFVCAKIAKFHITPLAAWSLVLPFAFLGVAEVFVRNNLMGIIGSLGALAGAAMFNTIVREESEHGDHRTAEVERSS